MRNYSRPFLKVTCLCLLVWSTTCLNKVVAQAVSNSQTVLGQQEEIIEGTVVGSDNGLPLPGVNISVKGAKSGAVTDFDGNFIIKAKPSDILVFTYVGFLKQEVKIGDKRKLNVVLKVDTAELDAVTVVAFGTQKKESVVASITTIKPEELRVPASNLTASFSGRIPGLISFQTTGEPGADNAEFFIRGVATFGTNTGPLILIDGMESSIDDLSRLDVDDLDSFSIMKDASAAALYGSRGANGVILVNTKRGEEGKARLSFKYETGYSSNVKDVDFADGITYMNLWNRANNRFDGGPPLVESFTQNRIDEATVSPNPISAPVTDWMKLLFKDYAINHRMNLNVSGGGKTAKYYLSTTYTKDTGILRVDDRNSFNSGIDLNKLQIRSNNDINITPALKSSVLVYLALDTYNGPIDGAASLFDKVRKTSPVLYPAFYEPDAANADAERVLFGNFGPGAQFINPYAESVKGYKEYVRTKFNAQFNLKYKISEDLNARMKLGYDLNSFVQTIRQYDPFYYNVLPGSYDKITKDYTLEWLNEDSNPEDALQFNKNNVSSDPVFYGEFALNYNKILNDKHTIGATLVSNIREAKVTAATELQASLPRRNIGYAGRLNYNYDTRYFAEFNFGYNGSERFSKDERFGFFPSIGAGWTISNESFWEPMRDVVNKLRFRGSYGFIGNDAIGTNDQRFLYLSRVNLNDGNRGYRFGEEYFSGDTNYSRNGVSFDKYANTLVTWETAEKFNLALDLGLFKNKIDLVVEYFSEKRDNIFLERTEIPQSFGLVTAISANSGEAKNSGFEFSLKGRHQFNKNFWFQSMANFTYATSERTKFDEPDFSATPWRSRVGLPINQGFGYVAERLFFDENDVENSPHQIFGGSKNVYGNLDGSENGYGPGDIKYMDINDDGVVDENDRVPMGYPTIPEINYGFGFTIGYHNWDFNCFFNGIARKSFFINSATSQPFRQFNDGGDRAITQLLGVYADNHWSEDNRDPYALWPRLTHALSPNNRVQSSWWLRDGSYLRLQQVEVGYTIPKNFIKQAMPVITSGRVYLSGRNLLTFSKFDLWDVSLSGNPYKYPVQKVINFGVRLKF